MRCYICGEAAKVLYPVAFGKIEIIAYVCKNCLKATESEEQGASN